MVKYRAARSKDWPQIERLLSACALPLAGAREHLHDFIVAESAGAIAGCIGAEVYGAAALLRSLAVRENARGQNIGVGLVDRLLMQLKHRNATSVALLTTTAEQFFVRRGFETVARAEIAAALQASHEFNGACPANATAMLLRR
ncbi:MAG: arsenic resistance N-acetyltransferase ArsN2 [Alphaproteobacteria bacterium]|nr:arsenic resistance N-acetyltransferase ArsN2 [Alphaproteobacteria bacterium]